MVVHMVQNDVGLVIAYDAQIWKYRVYGRDMDFTLKNEISDMIEHDTLPILIFEVSRYYRFMGHSKIPCILWV